MVRNKGKTKKKIKSPKHSSPDRIQGQEETDVDHYPCIKKRIAHDKHHKEITPQRKPSEVDVGQYQSEHATSSTPKSVHNPRDDNTGNEVTQASRYFSPWRKEDMLDMSKDNSIEQSESAQKTLIVASKESPVKTVKEGCSSSSPEEDDPDLSEKERKKEAKSSHGVNPVKTKSADDVVRGDTRSVEKTELDKSTSVPGCSSWPSQIDRKSIRLQESSEMPVVISKKGKELFSKGKSVSKGKRELSAEKDRGISAKRQKKSPTQHETSGYDDIAGRTESRESSDKLENLEKTEKGRKKEAKSSHGVKPVKTKSVDDFVLDDTRPEGKTKLNKSTSVPGCSSQIDTKSISKQETLEMIKEMDEYFGNSSQAMNTNYKLHVVTFLCNKFPSSLKSELRIFCTKHAFRLSALLTEIKKQNLSFASKSYPRRLLSFPSEPDATFQLEQDYLRAKQYFNNKQNESNRRTMKEIYDKFVVVSNKFRSCSTCKRNRLEKNEMFYCVLGHEHCRKCVTKSIKSDIKRNSFTFNCLEKFCERVYSIRKLHLLLDLETMSSLLLKLEERSTAFTSIDYIQCPFCQIVIMSSPDNDSILHCEYSNCRKISCRRCKRENHWPDPCSQ